MNNYMVHYQKGRHERLCFCVDASQEDIMVLAKEKDWSNVVLTPISYDPQVKLSLEFRKFVELLPYGACFTVNQLVGVSYGSTDSWELVPYKFREIPNDPKDQDKFLVMSDLRVYNPKRNQINTIEKIFHLHYT